MLLLTKHVTIFCRAVRLRWLGLTRGLSLSLCIGSADSQHENGQRFIIFECGF